MTEWWRGASIYQIYPRSFLDTNGDGVGDLPGVTERLDYVASLGVDAIWLSPFFTSPMRDFGYDVSDYCAVDPIFGALDDFDRLIESAHRLGLRVIIDQVLSHTSSDHPWFQESRQCRDNPKADWYVWADPKADGAPPNNWQSVFIGSCWTWDTRRQQYYLHNFLDSQPDLNLHNRDVQDALLAVNRFWLDRGVDGFRLDAINFAMHDPALRDNPVRFAPGRSRPFDYQHHIYNQSHADIPAFLERVRAQTDLYENRFLVAEVGGENALAEMQLYTQGPNRLHSAYSFVFLYAQELTPGFARQALLGWPQSPETGWPSWAFSNHDAPRAVSRWGSDPLDTGQSKLYLALLFSLRGNIFLYQGEELGLPQAVIPPERLTDPEAIANWPETLGRDGARTPLPWSAHAAQCGFSDGEPWLPVDENHRHLAVDQQQNDPDSPLNFVRRLTALRRRSETLRTGGLLFREAPNPLIVFERHAGAGQMLCAFNVGPDPVAWLPVDAQRWTVTLPVSLPVLQNHLPDVLPGYSGYFAETG